MPINNDETVVVPATSTPEKTFPHLWLTEVTFKAEENTQGELHLSTVPYNGDTGEIATDGTELISTENLWGAVQEVPQVAIAMQAIFDAVEPLKAWLANQEPVTEPEAE